MVAAVAAVDRPGEPQQKHTRNNDQDQQDTYWSVSFNPDEHLRNSKAQHGNERERTQEPGYCAGERGGQPESFQFRTDLVSVVLRVLPDALHRTTT